MVRGYFFCFIYIKDIDLELFLCYLVSFGLMKYFFLCLENWMLKLEEHKEKLKNKERALEYKKN